MNPDVDHFDHRAGEPADRWHPEHDGPKSWLNAEAPAEQGQKLRNRSRWRDKTINTMWAPTVCHQCGDTFDGRDIIAHLVDAHPGGAA
jgi:hypothetical protein